MVLLDDNPTLGDLFGREKLLQEVGKHAATCSLPQVLGVHGDWGSGKTSFLRQLECFPSWAAQTLSLSATQVSDKQVRQLQKKLPNLKINR